MATVYVTEIQVNLINNVTNKLTQINRQLNTVSNSTKQLQRSTESLGKAFTQIFVGREIEKWSMSGLRGIGSMIKAAGDLEAAMLSLRTATGMSASDAAGMGVFAQQLAATHTMSLTDAAKMTTIIGRSTFKSPGQIKALLGGTGGQAGIADFADTMKSAGVMGVEESTKLGLQFSNLVGGGDPAKALKSLDSFNRALESTTGSPQELFNIFKQISGTGQALGMDPTNLLQLSAIAQQKGLGTRTTTSLANQIMAIEMGRTGVLGRTKGGREHEAAMRKMGLLSGDNDIFAQLDKMRSFGAAHGQDSLTRELGTAFDKRGAKAFMDLLSPGTADVIKQLREEWSKLPSLTADHAMRMETVNALLAVFTTNLQSLQANLGSTLEPLTKPALKAFGDWAASAGAFVQAHPDLSRGTLLGAGGAMVGGALGGTGMILSGMWALMRGTGVPVRVVNGGFGAGAGGMGGGVGGAGGGLIGGASRFGPSIGKTFAMLGGGLVGAAGDEDNPLRGGLTGGAAAGAGFVLAGPIGAAVVTGLVAAAPAIGAALGEWSTGKVAGATIRGMSPQAFAEFQAAQKSLQEDIAATNKNVNKLAKHSMGHHIATGLMQSADTSQGAKAPAGSTYNPSVGAGSAGSL